MEKIVKKIILLSITILLIASAFMGPLGCTSKELVTLNVSAAASLTDALKEINGLYMQGKPSVTITPNFGASGTLQKQIENGAPADVFISAAEAQMDALEKQELILNDTRKNLLNNKIVLIVPRDRSWLDRF